jgi:hypothetical protein
VSGKQIVGPFLFDEAIIAEIYPKPCINLLLCWTIIKRMPVSARWGEGPYCENKKPLLHDDGLGL